jgi:hypothetical protein
MLRQACCGGMEHWVRKTADVSTASRRAAKAVGQREAFMNLMERR